MTTTSSQQNRSGADDGGSDDGVPEPAALLEQMRHSVAALARDANRALRRVRVTLGAASVEVEWDSRPVPEPSARPEPNALPAAAGAVPGMARDAVPAVAQNGAPAATPVAADNEHVVVAPLVGTFYMAPEPGAAPFVKAGDAVVAGQQIGIVEAMKLMNPVEADRSGTVVRVLAGDGSPVEFEQPLLVLAGANEE